MKKIIVTFILFILFAGVVSASSINGDYKGNPIVKVRVNFKDVNSEVPAMIIDGVTMVPLRAVSESMGGTVGWDPSTYTVNIVTDNPTTKPQPTVTPSAPAPTKIKGPLSIYSSDGKKYLGKLTADIYDVDSVFNQYGTYGSIYATDGVWNEYGTYGSLYSKYSVANKLATDPPVILDGDGNIVGRLTMNTSIKGAVSPIGLKDFLESSGY